MMRHLTVLLVVLTVLVATVGCSSSDEGGDESATTTQIEEPATTVAAPETVTTAASTTTTTEAAASPVVLDVTFTGEECVVAGPTEFPAAAPIELVYVNESEELGAAGFFHFLGNETFQDFVDYMGPEGPAKVPPSWVNYFGATLPKPGGETRTWEGNLEAGRYYLTCETIGQAQAYSLWYGAELTVE